MKVDGEDRGEEDHDGDGEDHGEEGHDSNSIRTCKGFYQIFTHEKVAWDSLDCELKPTFHLSRTKIFLTYVV